MKTRPVGLLLLALVLMTAVILVQSGPVGASSPTAPLQAAGISPGGVCYLAAPDACKIRVDPFSVSASPNTRLLAVQLRANQALIYDFRTDVSNPPSGSYSPSLVRQDFAAVCGATYTLTLLAKDSGDTDFVNIGQSAPLACPMSIATPVTPTATVGVPGGTGPTPTPQYRNYIPVIVR